MVERATPIIDFDSELNDVFDSDKLGTAIYWMIKSNVGESLRVSMFDLKKSRLKGEPVDYSGFDREIETWRDFAIECCDSFGKSKSPIGTIFVTREDDGSLCLLGSSDSFGVLNMLDDKSKGPMMFEARKGMFGEKIGSDNSQYDIEFILGKVFEKSKISEFMDSENERIAAPFDWENRNKVVEYFLDVVEGWFRGLDRDEIRKKLKFFNYDREDSDFMPNFLIEIGNSCFRFEFLEDGMIATGFSVEDYKVDEEEFDNLLIKRTVKIPNFCSTGYLTRSLKKVIGDASLDDGE